MNMKVPMVFPLRLREGLGLGGWVLGLTTGALGYWLRPSAALGRLGLGLAWGLWVQMLEGFRMLKPNPKL